MRKIVGINIYLNAYEINFRLTIFKKCSVYELAVIKFSPNIQK
jgi:hypothetical protein